MKLVIPRVAHGAARTGLGELSFIKNYTPRALGTSLSLRSSPLVPNTEYRPRCDQRRYTSDATVSLKEENPTGKTTLPSHESNVQQPPQSSSTSISDQVRLLMRRVPYPVAIITATDPSGPEDTTSFRGMTVSSFSTVTLTPHPVISFNVRRPSETLNALLASRRFLVHLLAPGPATATLARDFSKGNNTLAAILSGHGEFEFAALPTTNEEGLSQKPLPILKRRGESAAADTRADFPFVFECALHPQKIDVQDHSIVLGTVVRAIEGSESVLTQDGAELNEHSPEHLCLTYANTKFWKMGGEL
ncbi:FMN-binding split barrel-like protein [Penicillium paradoxum]|uniref:FMN-binding split barrel-like protein n=1 Tax=Penicillium paradoxum TaxID=176176 RepID=UPI002548E614|nr:FMN-binding split barrel-like protein [Penicillium paradoxum]KAJ5779682.1 FMN-binding split barrel-like protein [Penicillium paradoxum]